MGWSCLHTLSMHQFEVSTNLRLLWYHQTLHCWHAYTLGKMQVLVRSFVIFGRALTDQAWQIGNCPAHSKCDTCMSTMIFHKLRSDYVRVKHEHLKFQMQANMEQSSVWPFKAQLLPGRCCIKSNQSMYFLDAALPQCTRLMHHTIHPEYILRDLQG